MDDVHGNATTSSLDLLRERVEHVDAALQAALGTVVESVEEGARALANADDVWVTGTGGSEGPARLLACSLVEGGHRARFVPLSWFASRADRDGQHRTRRALVVFSQGLSPNARLALRRADEYDAAVVVTAMDPDVLAPSDERRRMLGDFERAGIVRLGHPPHGESGLLVRLSGPAAATLVALLLAAEMTGGRRQTRAWAERLAVRLGALPDLRARGRELRVPERTDLLALVTAAGYERFAHGHRWKLLESTSYGDPAIWDVLQLAHGPFQQFYARHALLIALETPSVRPLFDRLERILVPERHTLWRCPSDLEPPLCWLDHDAMVNGIMLALHARRPRDLVTWPGQGADAAIYELGSNDPSPT